jgi:hypothetical protein
MTKRNCTKSFCQNIAKLIDGINFNQFNISRANLFSKPVVLDGIVFRAWGHVARFKATKSKSSNIVLVDFDM